MARRVLLVEDSEDIRTALAELLELLGHRVEAVADGLVAVERARATQPEIVLVDLGIPGIDGLEVARRIRAELGGGPRLVALTGAAREEDRRRSREAGFEEHLVKPVDLAHLEAVISRAG